MLADTRVCSTMRKTAPSSTIAGMPINSLWDCSATSPSDRRSEVPRQPGSGLQRTADDLLGVLDERDLRMSRTTKTRCDEAMTSLETDARWEKQS